MFKRLGMLAGAALLGALVAAPPAEAADLPAKASASPYAYPTARCGLYYGLNSIGSTGEIANGSVGAQEVTGAAGLTVGYTCPVGTVGFWFIDGAFDLTNVNGSANGLSVSGPAFFEQRFGFGAPWNLVVQAIPILSTLQSQVPGLIPLPSGVTVNTSNPYVFFSTSEQDVSVQLGFAQGKEWLFAPGFGIGDKVLLSNSSVFDPFAEYVLNSNSICFGPIGGNNCQKLNQQVRAGFHIEF